MANVDIRVGKKDAVFFSANPTLILKDGQFLFNSDTLELFIGDGTTQLSALVAINVPPSSGVQSVTGSNVDNTDPLNPIIEPLGLIKIIDLDENFFTDLSTAKAYLRSMFSTIPLITDESFNNGAYSFTVPAGSEIIGAFMSDSFTPSITTASLIDNLGLLNFTNASDLFYMNEGKHVLADCNFNNGAFYYFNGTISINKINSIVNAGGNFAQYSTGTFIFNGDIGPLESANFGSGFFLNSTATILANASKYTSNSGAIHGDLQTAITNGCNVQFDGIDLEKVSNKSTSIVTDQASNIKYPSVKSVFDWVTALFATKGSIQNYYSGKRVTIPFAGTSSAINGWNGAIIYIPIPITSSVAFTDISQEVTALTVGSNIRLALYTSVNGLPSALLEDSGNISTSTTGIKNYVLSAPHSFTAVDKQVFVAIQASSAAVGLRYALNTVCFNYFNGSGQSGTLFYQVQVFGAFPATATPSVYPNANSPLVSLLVQ